MENVESRVLELRKINWRELQFIQANDFKDLPDDEKTRLKASMVGNNFVDPFKVWEDDEGILWCLDGKHRIVILQELDKEGIDIPYLLPATIIECKSKKEAAKLVLIYSSSYATITKEGMSNFIENYQLNWNELREEVSLTDFSVPRFEQFIDYYGTEKAQEAEDETATQVNEDLPLLVKVGDFFKLGNSYLLCADFQQDGMVEKLMQGKKARILMTDPPYNLAASEFTNKGENKHENFAFAGGEMSDLEFKDFLKKIMTTSIAHTVDGAIHFIFMDFRHCWHMTQAAHESYPEMASTKRHAYEPKQVCVWVKDLFANGSFYRAKHEFCFIFKSGTAKHLSKIDLMDRQRSNVWEYSSATSLANPDRDQLQSHPTPKNVSMVADAIIDTTDAEDGVIDYFMGSGTTLIACEQVGAVAYGTEIQPKYVQHIILRYMKFCQKQDKEIVFEHLNGNLKLEEFMDLVV
jgi:DNA modification methylase